MAASPMVQTDHPAMAMGVRGAALAEIPAAESLLCTLPATPPRASVALSVSTCAIKGLRDGPSHLHDALRPEVAHLPFAAPPPGARAGGPARGKARRRDGGATTPGVPQEAPTLCQVARGTPGAWSVTCDVTAE